MSESTTEGQEARRHIIKRPRLTRLLDETSARVILLVAPAGYGKTTLAREWLATAHPETAWYRATQASTDVAALAAALAEAFSQLIPGAGARMRGRLHGFDAPERNAAALGAMLLEDLRASDQRLGLAIDDYHLLAVSEASERFVQSLASAENLSLLITSRQRPTWIAA